MKALAILTLFSTFFITMSVPIAQETVTAKRIADRSFEATKLAGSEAILTMTIIDDKGRERIRQIAQVTKLFDGGNTEKNLVRFLAPADVKGTGLLTYDYKDKDDDLWLYMPALRKTRRIISSEKTKSFMGSEFSYADMTPPRLDDFLYTLCGEKVVEEAVCWEIEMVPIDEDVAEENGFSRKILYIGKEDCVIRSAVYYDLADELHKELLIKEIKQLDEVRHKYRPLHMIMLNKQNNRTSILKVNKIEFNPGVKDEVFTIRYLERE